MKNSFFSYIFIGLFDFCTPFIVNNSTEPLFDDINDENKMYALTQVSPCKIPPENFKIVDTHVTLYHRSYRIFVKVLMCKVTVMLIRYNCGMFSHSSIVHTAPIITYAITVSPEQCLNGNKIGKITVTEFDDDDIEFDIKHGIKTIKTKELILKVIHQHLGIIVVKLNIFLLERSYKKPYSILILTTDRSITVKD